MHAHFQLNKRWVLSRSAWNNCSDLWCGRDDDERDGLQAMSRRTLQVETTWSCLSIAFDKEGRLFQFWIDYLLLIERRNQRVSPASDPWNNYVPPRNVNILFFPPAIPKRSGVLCPIRRLLTQVLEASFYRGPRWKAWILVFLYIYKETCNSWVCTKPLVSVIRRTSKQATMANLCAFISLAAFLAVGIPSLVMGQVVLPGECPKYATQARFNPAQVKLNVQKFKCSFNVEDVFCTILVDSLGCCCCV